VVCPPGEGGHHAAHPVSGSHRRYGERRSRGGGDRLRLRLRLRRYDCGLRSPLNAPFPCQVRMGGARRKAAAERGSRQ
jgi:hypothetical protein